MSMKSKWMVTHNPALPKPYGVYRLLHANGVDHSGNREVAGYYKTREAAEELAEEMNNERAE